MGWVGNVCFEGRIWVECIEFWDEQVTDYYCIHIEHPIVIYLAEIRKEDERIITIMMRWCRIICDRWIGGMELSNWVNR